ncbi:unnamed protein product [Caenorhabditis brenneri]
MTSEKTSLSIPSRNTHPFFKNSATGQTLPHEKLEEMRIKKDSIFEQIQREQERHGTNTEKFKNLMEQIRLVLEVINNGKKEMTPESGFIVSNLLASLNHVQAKMEELI